MKTQFVHGVAWGSNEKATAGLIDCLSLLHTICLLFLADYALIRQRLYRYLGYDKQSMRDKKGTVPKTLFILPSSLKSFLLEAFVRANP
jgi:hypothetical protein